MYMDQEINLIGSSRSTIMPIGMSILKKKPDRCELRDSQKRGPYDWSMKAFVF